MFMLTEGKLETEQKRRVCGWSGEKMGLQREKKEREEGRKQEREKKGGGKTKYREREKQRAIKERERRHLKMQALTL